MPYYNPTYQTTQNTNSNYIEYVDTFTAEGVKPTCGIRNFILLFDNFDGHNPLQAIKSSKNTLYQMTIFYLLHGTVTFEINGHDVVINEGQVLTTMPENIVGFKSASSDIRYFMLVVYPKLVSYTFNDLGKNYTNAEFSRTIFINDCPSERLSYCRDIYVTMKEDMIRPPYEFKLVYQRSWLSVMLVQNFLTHGIDTQKNGDSNSRQYDVYCRFLEALNKFSGEHRSVQYYADLLDISSKYLSFVCISYSNKNASTWIDEYVVQKAKVLMTVHKYSVADVSEMLNFQTSSSFSRYFKRVTGLTPKDYLAKNK